MATFLISKLHQFCKLEKIVIGIWNAFTIQCNTILNILQVFCLITIDWYHLHLYKVVLLQMCLAVNAHAQTHWALVLIYANWSLVCIISQIHSNFCSSLKKYFINSFSKFQQNIRGSFWPIIPLNSDTLYPLFLDTIRETWSNLYPVLTYGHWFIKCHNYPSKNMGVLI